MSKWSLQMDRGRDAMQSARDRRPGSLGTSHGPPLYGLYGLSMDYLWIMCICICVYIYIDGQSLHADALEEAAVLV